MGVVFTGASETDAPAIPPRFVEETEPPAPAPEVGIEVLSTPTAYDMALSHVLAALMTEDVQVKRFRAAHLDSELLPWADVAGWMSARAARSEGAAITDVTTRYVTLPVSPAALWEAQERVIAGRPRTVTFEISDVDLLALNPWPRSISYVVPHDAIPRQQYVKEGNAVERLLELVNHLVTSVPWTEAQASVFGLTGLTPLVLPLRGVAKYYLRMPTLPRLVLELDPRMSQRELAAEYQKARTPMASDIRHRDLSEKHLALAVFGTLPEGRDGTLVQRMERWNAAHPEWAYRHTFIFSRDITRAQRRLLRDLFPHPEDEPEGEE
jgi:hypothetical protein